MYSIATRLLHYTETDDFQVRKNIPTAIDLLERCIDEHGHIPAMQTLAHFLTTTYKGVKDFPRAVNLYSRCVVEANDCDAMLNLAGIFHRGENGVNKDVLHAMRLYERCLDQGYNPEACYKLAEILLSGSPVIERDRDRAFQLCLSCAYSHFYVVRELAYDIQFGHSGMPLDIPLAAQLYQACIDEANDRISLARLAELLGNGAGIERDMNRAYELFETFFETDDCSDQLMNFANLFDNNGHRHYSDCNSVSLNVPFAMKLYELCLRKTNNTHCMLCIANILATGAPGVEKDIDRTLELCERNLEESNDNGFELSFFAENFRNCCGGRHTDVPLVAKIYEMCIEKSGNLGYLCSLVLLLTKGWNSAESDFDRAKSACENYFEMPDVNSDYFEMETIAKVFYSTELGGNNDFDFARRLYELAISKWNKWEDRFGLATLLIGREEEERDEKRAIKLYESCLDSGEGWDRVRELAECVEVGISGMEKNVGLAVDLYEMCVEKGYDEFSLLALAKIFAFGAEGVERDAVHAAEVCERYLNVGYDVCDVRDIARTVGEGRDQRLAKELYEICVEKCGDVESLIGGAEMLAAGTEIDTEGCEELCKRYLDLNGGCDGVRHVANVSRDKLLATKLYELCIEERNDGKSMIALGEVLLTGTQGVNRDVDRGIELCKRSLGNHWSGDVRILGERLMRCSMEGDGRNAVQLLEMCIERPLDYYATYNALRVLCNERGCIDGDDVRQLIELSEMWMKEGDCEAMIDLADMLADGTGRVERNARLAVELYEKCVKECGNFRAMFNIAEVFAVGAPDVEKDVERAREMFTRCVEEGLDCDARDRLEDMRLERQLSY